MVEKPKLVSLFVFLHRRRSFFYTLSLSLSLSLSSAPKAQTKKHTATLPALSLSTHRVAKKKEQDTHKKEMMRKTLRFQLARHFGRRVFRQRLLPEVLFSFFELCGERLAFGRLP